MLERNGDAGVKLARLALGLPGIKSFTLSESGRGLPQASFEVEGHAYALIYDPTKGLLEGRAIDKGYFPSQIADHLDQVLTTRRVLNKSGLTVGRNSHYEWSKVPEQSVTPSMSDHPKNSRFRGGMFERVKERLIELIINS